MQCDIAVMLICISNIAQHLHVRACSERGENVYLIIWNVLYIGIIKLWCEILMQRAFNYNNRKSSHVDKFKFKVLKTETVVCV